MAGVQTTGAEVTYEVLKDSISITPPLGTSTYDIQLAYDQNVFSPSHKNSNEQISIFYNNKEQGMMDVISENKIGSNITIPYLLDSRETNIQLVIIAYDINGQIIAQLQENIDINAIPDEYELSQNYPNPFNPVTKIEYGLPEKGQVKLVIYDILGMEVLTLVDGLQEAGYKTITWNGMNQTGRLVSAGMYFYAIQANDFRQVRKMILLK